MSALLETQHDALNWLLPLVPHLAQLAERTIAMMTRGELIELALGKDSAGKVDTAIPQEVFDGMTSAARDNIAGWYYAPEAKIFGRLLTQEECWREVINKLRSGELTASLAGVEDVGHVVVDWPCLRYHAERSEIIISVKETVNK